MFFFFFKQKTAYEMRISDWRSDVCSSDLMDAELFSRLLDCVRVGLGERGEAGVGEAGGLDHAQIGGVGGDAVLADAVFHGQNAGDLFVDRKGGGVGKSVSVRVDLGGRRTLKKKKLCN